MIVSHKSRMIDRDRALRRNKQIIMSHAAAGMPLVAVAAAAATADGGAKTRSRVSRSATSQRVNEPRR